MSTGPRVLSVTPSTACPRDDRLTTPVSQNSTACWGRFLGRLPASPQVVKEPARRAAVQPGSVDMLGPTARSPTGHHGSRGADRLTAGAIGALLCAP
jgi:hypothetical protein